MSMATMLINMIQHGESRTSASFLTDRKRDRQTEIKTERQTKRKDKERNTKQKLTWRYLGLQHIHSDNVDQHNPAWRIEHLRLILNEGDDIDEQIETQTKR
jgi:glucose dehydrogenase